MIIFKDRVTGKQRFILNQCTLENEKRRPVGVWAEVGAWPRGLVLLWYKLCTCFVLCCHCLDAESLIPRCIVSGDELFSDTYRYKETDGGIFYEVDGKVIKQQFVYLSVFRWLLYNVIIQIIKRKQLAMARLRFYYNGLQLDSCAYITAWAHSIRFTDTSRSYSLSLSPPVCLHGHNSLSQRVTETSDMSGVNIGGNASAEEETEEAAEASSVSGCNIVLANRLVQTRYAKKDYRAYIKVSCETFEL